MKRDTWIAAGAFLSIPLAILSASVICTYAIARGASMQWRMLFRLFCHGIPKRCLTLWEVPMPICARCTAVYAGFLAGLLLFIFFPWIEERLLRLFLFVASAPMIIDGVTQALRLRESTNDLRIATGLAAGLSFGMWALGAIERPQRGEFSTS
ncbi:MAG TPA: DUF2085 domain-containing protein [Thermoanaerobaculia bacterium]|nr:DUF2085 domain-containing protein [Thermoanaerobaculia bacterium]